MGRTVLIAMDMQQGLIGNIEGIDAILEKVSKTTKAARTAGVPVIYVTISFRSGQPELSSHNMSARRIKETGRSFTDGEAAVQIHPAISPEANDILVTKRRVSAFGGSDLDVVLRGLGAERLVLAGFATSGVVLSTVRQAADLDYELTVLSDLCFDSDPEVHRVLMEKIFTRQAQVIPSDVWRGGLESQ